MTGNFDLTLSNFAYPLIYVKGIIGFVLAFAITYFTIPEIIKVSHRKNLMDVPTERSSHKVRIPRLGGVAVFYAVAIVAPILSYQLFEHYKFLFPSLVILLFIGVLDDVIVMRPYKKLIAQILVAALMVVGSDVRLRSFFGFLGIYELPYLISVVFSIFTFVIVINAFNLIDGIDGLAAGFVFLATLFFSLSYFRLGIYNFPLVVLGTIIMGALGAFLIYNLSNNPKRKIFLGDTGSLLLGFLLCFISFCFIDIFINRPFQGIPQYYLKTVPAITMSIIILPLVDTLNVIIVRVLTKKPLFKADNNHIHHKVIAMGFSHRQASAIILSCYTLIVVMAYCLRHIDVNLLFVVVFGVGFILAYLPNFINYIKKDKKQSPSI